MARIVKLGFVPPKVHRVRRAYIVTKSWSRRTGEPYERFRYSRHLITPRPPIVQEQGADDEDSPPVFTECSTSTFEGGSIRMKTQLKFYLS